jgi:acyl carrier protein
MAQLKGKTGNPNGRPKGKQNKTTTELKEAINLIVSNNIDKLQRDIDSLEAKDRLVFIEKLFKYSIPPLQAEPPKEEANSSVNTFIENMLSMQKDSDKITAAFKKRQAN